jgi:hypothetical protein
MPKTPARWGGTIFAGSGLPLIVILFVTAVTSPARACIDLWNASDNAAVRGTVAAEGYRHAALNAYTAEGEAGRACYVTMLDRTGEPQGSFVIWPDNLFDNGALHDYAGPFFEEEGYMSHLLSRDPILAVSDNGHIQRI